MPNVYCSIWAYQHQFSEQWTTQANLTYNQHETIIDSNPFLENQRYHPGSEDVLLEWTNFIKQGKLNWLLGGMAYSVNSQLENSPKHHGMSYSLYAQGQYELTKALRLVAGGQWIKPVDVNAHFVPRLGLIYQFSERWGAKLLYGEAFRTAFNEERFIKRPLLIGNPQLKPELIKAVDLNLFYNSRDYQLSATYFTDQEQDLIIKVPHPTIKNAYIYDNAGEIAIRGLELEAKLKPTQQLFITSALTYQVNQNQEDKEDYTTIPNWMAKLGISYEFGKHSSISVFDSYFSQPGDVKVRYPDVKYLNPQPEAFHLVTLNLRMNLQPWLGESVILTGYVYNLLNEKIYAPESERSRINSIPARAGRSFYLGLEYRFK
jgi:outer membrane receptor for ferrienterochelin and colicin